MQLEQLGFGLESIASLFTKQKQGHSHSHDAFAHPIVETLASGLEGYSPLGATFICISVGTLTTSSLIALSPALSGRSLNFMVAFALGVILYNIFFTYMPEVIEHGSQLSALIAFLVFCMGDKLLRSGPHSHSHSHSHSPESEVETNSAFTLVNFVTDFAHNVVDGMALVSAFSRGASQGVAMYTGILLHEVPHQYADVIILQKSGFKLSAALAAHVGTSLGTVLGGIFYSFNMGAGAMVDMSPYTLGAFLYIATVGVLPELLESPVEDLFAEAFGLILGIIVSNLLV